MDIKNCYCVIMAGGVGKRFWPLSRTSVPKQFLDVADTGETFIRKTYKRFLNIVPKENIIIVTADRYKDLVKEQIPEISDENLLLEPYSRNTAPCIAYATYALLKRNPDAHIVVTPSDHLIGNEDIFAETILNGFRYISDHDVLMTLGVVPTRPDTNYGYIQACGGREAYKSQEPMPVKTFTEKPDKALAQILIGTGEFFWNSGIFLCKADIIRQEMEEHLPEVTRFFTGWESAIGTKLEREFILKAYTDSLNVSLDNGLLEKTERAWIYPTSFGWQDVGTWESLYNYIPGKDRFENAIVAENTLLEATSDTLVISKEKKKLIAIKGLENFMVIDTDDVLVICPKDDKKFKDFISGIAMPDYEKYR